VKKLAIIIDNLMADAPVVERLRSRGMEVTTTNLLSGHFRITDRCGILYVSAEEFSRWTAERDVYRRVSEFKRAVREPVVIVEGKKPTNGKTPSPGAMRGALAFLAVHNRIPVLFSATEAETADLIYAMANQIQNGMGERLGAIGTEPEAAKTEGGSGNGNGSSESLKPCEQIVRLVPDVGPTTAKAMLQRFGNLRGLFTASTRELTKIEGVGPKKAKRIAAFFDCKCE
jgi:ERCC4-type nuclease